MKALNKAAILGLLLWLLAGCSSEPAPIGRWEGYLEDSDWIIAVRLQVEEANTIYATALSVEVEGMSLAARQSNADEIKRALPVQWEAASSGEIEFRRNILTRKGGVAPLFVHDPSKNTMTFNFYAGGKLTRTVLLVPVRKFSPGPDA
jgi:hypothetical protein